MGYASYLEDIRDRLEEAMAGVQTVSSGMAAEQRRKTQGLLDACKVTLAQIDEFRDLVDDPRFDLAYEIAELDREKAELRKEVTHLVAKRERLLAHVRQLEQTGKEKNAEIR